MPVREQRAVWDTCVVLDAIQKTPERYDLIEPFLRDAERGQFQIVLSEGSVAELSHLGSSPLPTTEQEEMIERWLDNPYIVRRAVHPGISRKASELGREYRIKRLGDRLVVATAVLEGIQLIHTFDGYGDTKPGLLALDGVIGTPPLRITIPNYGQGTLYDAVKEA